MKTFGERIGLYRVAAVLIGCALVLELVRVQVLDGSGAGGVACTFGEVAFLAAAASLFLTARRRGRR